MGSFVVDLLDHAEKKIVWQGLAQGRLANEKLNELSVKDRNDRLFKSFPVEKIKTK